jgi:S1-C subfamily serine protease
MRGAWIAAVLATALLVGDTHAADIGQKLQAASVNIKAGDGYGSTQGSGTVFLVPRDGKNRKAFVITAHHVIDGLREVKSVINDEGDEKKLVQYKDAQIVQEIQSRDGSRVVGDTRLDAQIISVDPSRDIALMLVRADDRLNATARFYLDEDIPHAGTEVYHCGAPGGQKIGGTSTLTAGIISRTGVRIPEFGGTEGIFDQTDTAALGGSSGGMVCLRSDGRWAGLLTLGLGGGDNFHWVVPVRTVKQWAKEIGAEWLLDPKATVTDEQIEAVPLELHGKGKANANRPTPAPTAENVFEWGTMERNTQHGPQLLR